jgi:peptide/nickel transport system ATP-binding protein
MNVHAELTQRMFIMYAGKIIEAGSTEEIFEEPLHPYTYFLINSLPQIGDKSRKLSLRGKPPH